MRGFLYKSIICFLIGFFWLSNVHSLVAQNSFSVSTDTVLANKPADIYVFYNYVEFENNTADTLQMRWEKVETISTNPGEPGILWTISVQDPVNYYNPANDLETGDFFLGPIASSTDKFLLHLFPNNQSGNLIVKFKYYPIDNPQDSALVVFDYNADRILDVEDFFVENNFKIIPNPSTQFFNISNNSNQNSTISVFDAQGKVLKFIALNASETKWIDSSSWSNGIYFIKIDCDGKSGFKQIVVKNL